MGYREADIERKRSKGAQGRDIGEIPEIVNLRRRKKCKTNLSLFLKTYMPASFPLPFGDCHKRAIRKMENSLLHGEKFALAMPRGSGKTTMAEGALIWASCYGHREYVVIVHANAEKSKNSIESIRREFESNEILAEDFPEVVYPVVKLDGIALRANGQLCRGKPTNIRWGARIVFPTVDESTKAGNAGCVIEAVGIGGSVRGRRFTDSEGVKRRPDFVLLDDPQDREDAESQGGTNKLERIINADVSGMAGHKKTIAGVLLCTVISKDDLADRLLSHRKHPEWRGEKTAMITKFPKSKDTLWLKYFILRREGLADGDGGDEATKFYHKNRKAMDEDAVVSWPARHAKGETAIQCAMNLLCDLGEEAFASEYQNDPIENVVNMTRLDEEIVLSRIGIHARHEVPADSVFLLCGIDINLYGLTFCVVAFKNDYTTTLIDYGMTSDGGKQRSEMTDLQYVATMLTATLNEIDGRPYAAKLNGVLIDRGYMPDAVKSVIKATKKRYSLAASLGRATKEYKPPKDARRAGNGWYEKDMDGVLTIVHNTDLYRVQAQRAFLLGNGVPGGVSLWNDTPRQHRTFAQQICNEFLCGVNESGKHDWRQKPNTRHDALDALVMCYAGSSVMGCGSVQKARQKAQNKAPIEATYSNL